MVEEAQGSPRLNFLFAFMHQQSSEVKEKHEMKVSFLLFSLLLNKRKLILSSSKILTYGEGYETFPTLFMFDAIPSNSVDGSSGLCIRLTMLQHATIWCYCLSSIMFVLFENLQIGTQNQFSLNLSEPGQRAHLALLAILKMLASFMMLINEAWTKTSQLN